ncbi:divergent PAP2 family protein [Chloroflexota bacterium]
MVIPISAWALSQLLKVVIILVREKRLDLWFLVRSGGMPSSHTALVCSLATAVAMIEGVDSVTFAVAAILAMVVMYDAAGVRRSVSRQAVVLNRIVKEFWVKRPKGEIERNLREFIGHTPFQVVVGAFLGVAFTWVWIVAISF